MFFLILKILAGLAAYLQIGYWLGRARLKVIYGQDHTGFVPLLLFPVNTIENRVKRIRGFNSVLQENVTSDISYLIVCSFLWPFQTLWCSSIIFGYALIWKPLKIMIFGPSELFKLLTNRPLIRANWQRMSGRLRQAFEARRERKKLRARAQCVCGGRLEDELRADAEELARLQAERAKIEEQIGALLDRQEALGEIEKVAPTN